MKLEHTLTFQPESTMAEGKWLYEGKTVYFGKTHRWYARLSGDPRPYPKLMEDLEVQAKRAIRAHIIAPGHQR